MIASLERQVPEEKRVLQPSPIMLRKSKKLGIEGNSMKEAQIKDSVALVEFFAFLEKEVIFLILT